MDMTAFSKKIRTHWIGKDIPWCFGIADDQGAVEAGVTRFLIDEPPQMRRVGNPCAHLPIKVRVQRGLSTKYWHEWWHSGLWPTSVRRCGGPLGVFRAPDPLAGPREFGWMPPWRDCPALWRLGLGRNDVSTAMMCTHVMNRSGVGMGRSYRTMGLGGVVPGALL